MDYLPKCITHLVLQYLDTKELIYFRRTCKYWDKLFKFNLKYLSLYLPTSVEDKHLQYLKGVHTIDLGGCNEITDKGLQYLKGVHSINLWGCDNITDEGLEYLKGVHTIDLRWCNYITDKGLQYLKKANPNVKIYR